MVGRTKVAELTTMNEQYRRQTQAEAAPASSSRPTLSFPLGTALLLIVVFCLSGALSCFYHWEKLRPLRRRREGDEEEDASRRDSVSQGVPSPPAKAEVPNQVRGLRASMGATLSRILGWYLTVVASDEQKNSGYTDNKGD